MSLPERQSELVGTHRAIQSEGLPYILVGGWAVSAFQTRFTTNVDMVLPAAALDDYDALLDDLGYTKERDEDVANVYEGRFVQYEKSIGENTVSFEARRCITLPSDRCRVVLPVSRGAQRRRTPRRG